MTIEDRVRATLGDGTRESVTVALDWLADRYGDVPVERVTVENDPDFFEHGVQVAARRELGDAGAWVEDGDGRVLFIRHPNSPDRWGVPGGGVEPGETPAETAVREVREETGVDARITNVWKARHKTIVHREDAERRLHMLTAWFEGVAEVGSISLNEAAWESDEEILEARWFEFPPDAVHDPFSERVQAWGES